MPLTDVEKQICRALCISETDFAVRKNRQGSEAEARMVREANLNDAALTVCKQLGIAPKDFIARRRVDFEKEIMRRRPAGGTVVASTRGAFIGRDVLDEQLAALKRNIKDQNAEVPDLIAAAEKELRAYDIAAAAGDDDAYQRLGCAAAILVVALDKVSPAWAERHPEAAAGEAKEARDRGRDSVQSPFGEARTQASARGGRTRIGYGVMYASSGRP